MTGRVTTLNKTRLNTAQQLHSERAWTTDRDWTHSETDRCHIDDRGYGTEVIYCGSYKGRWLRGQEDRTGGTGERECARHQQQTKMSRRAGIFSLTLTLTRDDCEKTNQECFVVFSEYRVWMECVWWDDEAVKLVLVFDMKHEFRRRTVAFFFRLIRTKGVKTFLFLHYVSLFFLLIWQNPVTARSRLVAFTSTCQNNRG